MDLSKQIMEACGVQYRKTGGVMPIQVCHFCMGCVIPATHGITGEPVPVPQGHEREVRTWLKNLMVED